MDTKSAWFCSIFGKSSTITITNTIDIIIAYTDRITTCYESTYDDDIESITMVNDNSCTITITAVSVTTDTAYSFCAHLSVKVCFFSFCPVSRFRLLVSFVSFFCSFVACRHFDLDVRRTSIYELFCLEIMQLHIAPLRLLLQTTDTATTAGHARRERSRTTSKIETTTTIASFNSGSSI